MEVESVELGVVADDRLVVAPKLRVDLAPRAHLPILEVAERVLLEVVLGLRLPPRREPVAVDQPRVLVGRVPKQPVALLDGVLHQLGHAD
eukprot:963168-Prymnesium_polylepis.1